MSKPTITVAKGRRLVAVKVDASARDSYGGPVSIATKVSVDITTEAARKLAADIIAIADVLDAASAKEAAHQERRKKYQEREIAAGRMKVFSAKEFFRR